jgi:predicted ArsR family transcriptional regulator
MTVEGLAATVDLHVNTVREHLDRLIAAGFVAREPETRCTRGRPRMLYSAVERVAPEASDDLAREHLARILMAGYGHAAESPAAAAESAGLDWAGMLPSQMDVPALVCPVTGSQDQADVVSSQLTAIESYFETLGFEPEVDADDLVVHLHRCPFYALAIESTEVVCNVHLGLCRGVLARSGGPLVADRLDPFVGPQHCVLHLSRV